MKTQTKRLLMHGESFNIPLCNCFLFVPLCSFEDESSAEKSKRAKGQDRDEEGKFTKQASGRKIGVSKEQEKTVQTS